MGSAVRLSCLRAARAVSASNRSANDSREATGVPARLTSRNASSTLAIRVPAFPRHQSAIALANEACRRWVHDMPSGLGTPRRVHASSAIFCYQICPGSMKPSCIMQARKSKSRISWCQVSPQQDQMQLHSSRTRQPAVQIGHTSITADRPVVRVPVFHYSSVAPAPPTPSGPWGSSLWAPHSIVNLGLALPLSPSKTTM